MSDEGTPPPPYTTQSDVSMRREFTVVDSSIQRQYSSQMSVDGAAKALEKVRIKDDHDLTNSARDRDSSTGDSNNRKVSRNRKARSLYGVSPHCKFGPKGALLETSTTVLTIPDPASQKLYWHKPPLSVLVIRKLHDESVIMPFKELIVWLVQVRKMLVFVESGVLDEHILVADEEFKQIQNKLQFFTTEKDDLSNKIDFIICLGGDGTLLYASSLFQQSVPPVMAFNMGSLGFLTPFQFQNYRVEITQALDGSASLLLRYRLKCVLCKADSECARVPIKHKDLTGSACGKYQYLALNEVTVDRGSSPYLGNVDLYVEGHLVTSVQGDGLIISTPTGSTAYAVAAGASMIHPNVPCILITPICPHSLSFRPIVVPAGVEIKVKLSPDARSTACVSFDGRNRQEMLQGDILRITTAAYPVPSVCAKTQVEDWFDGLADCLHWNVRKTQKALASSSPSTSSLLSLDQEELPGSSQS